MNFSSQIHGYFLVFHRKMLLCCLAVLTLSILYDSIIIHILFMPLLVTQSRTKAMFVSHCFLFLMNITLLSATQCYKLSCVLHCYYLKPDCRFSTVKLESVLWEMAKPNDCIQYILQVKEFCSMFVWLI